MPSPAASGAEASPAAGAAAPSPPLPQQDAPACHVCGSLMARSGTCYTCPGCGATSGCG